MSLKLSLEPHAQQTPLNRETFGSGRLSFSVINPPFTLLSTVKLRLLPLKILR